METVDLWPNGPKIEKCPDAAPVGTDSILLADFVPLSGCRRALDMGTGSGIISILLLCRSEKLTVDAVEIMPAAAANARRNAELNGLESRVNVIEGDFRLLREKDVGKYDVIVTNPPYYAVESGERSPDSGRSAARDEGMCTLAELLETASKLLGPGGKFCMVYPVPKMRQAMSEAASVGLEPKRMRLVQARIDAPPSVFLMECRRNGKPGLTVEPVLIIKDASGGDSAEVRRIYHIDG